MTEQFTVMMLGGFEVYRDGQVLDLPPSCQRLVALAALKRRTVPRSWVCQTLWPTTRPDRATARLRTTLWRLRPMGADALLTVGPQSIALSPDVTVDWHDAVDLIGQLLGHSEPPEPDHDAGAELLPLLRAGALLDGWTDDWNAHARDTYRELRLDALDALMSGRSEDG
ncbi:transcriptional regulator [Mycolicibacterium moriokaense]|nr:transcriptional regulator [Mycolicibacterium moriokaense]